MFRVIRLLRHACVVVLMLVVISASAAHGQTTAFTYQGQLSDAGALANGSYDMRFALFDSAAGGAQIGANQDVPAVPVSNGVFTVQLDFGVAAFPGANRFVEIGVQPAGGGDTFTTLAPRQQISTSPYAIRTLSAATADALSSACVRCVTNAQIRLVAGSKVFGTIPTASLPTDSGNYIQNTSAQQASSNFNISGNGVVGGDLTVAGTLTANVSGNFVQNGTTPQAGGNFNVGGNGTVGGVLSAGRAAIGTTDPTIGGLHVVGAAGIPAIYGESANRGVWGKSTGSSRGVYGESVSGEGVFGISTSGIGVSGTSASASPGVQGLSTGNGGVGVRGDATTGVYGTGTSGSGVYGESAASQTLVSSGVYGKSTGDGGIGVIGEANVNNAVGVYGVSASPNGFGVHGRNLSDGFAMSAEGNTTQVRDKGGWVKAMLFVDVDGTIIRCFNSTLAGSAPSTGNCGFNVQPPDDSGFGAYEVDLGFRVNDRFVSVTPTVSGTENAGAHFEFGSTANVLRVGIFVANQAHATAKAPFMVIVF